MGRGSTGGNVAGRARGSAVLRTGAPSAAPLTQAQIVARRQQQDRDAAAAQGTIAEQRATATIDAAGTRAAADRQAAQVAARNREVESERLSAARAAADRRADQARTETARIAAERAREAAQPQPTATPQRFSQPTPDSFTGKLLNNQVTIKGIGPEGSRVTYNNNAVPAAAQRIFGRNMSERDLLSVIGAPKGSRVTFTGSNEVIRYNVRHPDLNSYSGTLKRSATGAEVKIGGMFTYGSKGLGTRIGLGILANAKKYGVTRMSTTAGGDAANLARSQLRGNAGASGGAMTGFYSWPNLGGKLSINSNTRERLARDFNMTGVRTTNDLMIKYGKDGMKAWKKVGHGGATSWDLRSGSKQVAIMNGNLQRIGRRLADGSAGD